MLNEGNSKFIVILFFYVIPAKAGIQIEIKMTKVHMKNQPLQQNQPEENSSLDKPAGRVEGPKSNKKVIVVAVIVLVLLAVGAGAYWYLQDKPFGCTEEVKVCPDGTTVGRTGLNCEFAACPNNQNAVPKITVISPNGGEKLYMGKSYDIKWSSDTEKNLDIRLIEGEGLGDRYIAQNIPNSGVYSWTIPDCRPGNECSSNFQIPAGQYKISIHEVGTSDIEDISDALFSIMASQDQTASWQTYRNDKYGFELKYPNNYEVKMVKATVLAFGPINFSVPAPLSIEFVKPIPDVSLDSLVEAKTANLEIRDCKKTTLAGKAAYECLDLGAVSSYLLISKNNDYLYKLLFNTGNKDTLAENRVALDMNQKLILSTFKFMK